MLFEGRNPSLIPKYCQVYLLYWLYKTKFRDQVIESKIILEYRPDVLQEHVF